MIEIYILRSMLDSIDQVGVIKNLPWSIQNKNYIIDYGFINLFFLLLFFKIKNYKNLILEKNTFDLWLSN